MVGELFQFNLFKSILNEPEKTETRK